MQKNAKKTVSWLSAIILAVVIWGSQAFAQEAEPGPEMGGPDGGAPQQDSFDPDNPPVEPQPPDENLKKPLELDLGWLEVRNELCKIFNSCIEEQFGDMKYHHRPTSNPMVQRFREYYSEKKIVSEWSRTRPFGIDWSYPIPEVEESIESIQENLNRELENDAIKKFPELTREQYLAEGEKLYSMYKFKDIVEFQLLQGGRGVATKVKGRLRGVDTDMIVIEPRRLVSRYDMPREVAARFFPDEHAAMVKEYADKAKQACELNRKNYVYARFIREMPRNLLAANYVPDHIRFGETFSTKIFKRDQWVSRKYLVMEWQRMLWERKIDPEGKRKGWEKTDGWRIFSIFMDQQGFRWVWETDEQKNRIHGIRWLYEITCDVSSVYLSGAIRGDEYNPYRGFVPQAHIVKLEKKVEDIEEYKRREKQYKEDLKDYKEKKKAWDERKKAWDEQQEAGEDAEGGEANE